MKKATVPVRMFPLRVRSVDGKKLLQAAKLVREVLDSVTEKIEYESPYDTDVCDEGSMMLLAIAARLIETEVQ
jgi:hypothetical protein